MRRGLVLGVGYGVSIRRQVQKCPEYGGLDITSVRLSPCHYKRGGRPRETK